MAGKMLSVSEPLQRGWEWMQTMLFRPFAIEKWFVVGFAAWLANLGSGGSGFSWSSDNLDPRDVGGLVSVLGGGWDFLETNSFLGFWIAALVAVIFLLIVAVFWLSSYGKFIFLDNVVRNQAAIVEPWKRLAPQAKSLFLFRVSALALGIPAFGAILGLMFRLGVLSDRAGGLGVSGPVVGVTVALIGAGLLFVVLVLLLVFGAFLLEGFVVPIMHRYNLRVMDGWRRFLPMLRSHLGSFILLGVLLILLAILVGLAIVVTGFMTCCLGFILLILPYIGTVVPLPLYVTYRALTLEFLGQIDPAFRLGADSTVAEG